MKGSMRFGAVLSAALLAVVTLFPASPADAREGELTRVKLRTVTRHLLEEYVAPAVTNGSGVRVVVRNCHAAGLAGMCYGRVRAGSVVCRGRFKVRESAKNGSWTAWPLRMRCAS